MQKRNYWMRYGFQLSISVSLSSVLTLSSHNTSAPCWQIYLYLRRQWETNRYPIVRTITACNISDCSDCLLYNLSLFVSLYMTSRSAQHRGEPAKPRITCDSEMRSQISMHSGHSPSKRLHKCSFTSRRQLLQLRYVDPSLSDIYRLITVSLSSSVVNI